MMDRRQWMAEREFLWRALSEARAEISFYKNLLQKSTRQNQSKQRKINPFKLPREILCLIFLYDGTFRQPFQSCLREATSRILYKKVFLPYIHSMILKPFFVDIKDCSYIIETIFHPMIENEDEQQIHFSVIFKDSFQRTKVLDVAIFEENDPRLRTFMAMDYLRPACIPDLILAKKYDLSLHVASMMKKLYPTNRLVEIWNLKDTKTRESLLNMYQEFHNYTHLDNLRFGDISRHFYFQKMFECDQFSTPLGNFVLILVMDYSR